MENNQSTVTQPIIDLQNVAVGYDNREDVLQNIYFSAFLPHAGDICVHKLPIRYTFRACEVFG